MVNSFKLPEDLPRRYHYSLKYEMRLSIWTYSYHVTAPQGVIRAYGGIRHDDSNWCTISTRYADADSRVGWSHVVDVDPEPYAKHAAALQHDVVFHLLARLADKRWPQP